MPVTFDTETIKLVALFENITHVSVKDCLMDGDNTVYFVISEGNVGKAIGKNGSSVRHAENLIRKDVKLVEFSNDLDRFIRNLIPKTNFVKIKNEDNRISVDIWVDKNYKSIVIGRDGKNLKIYKELLQRCHDVSDVTIR